MRCCLVIFLSLIIFEVNAQQVRVIDNKGTIRVVTSNRVTSSTITPPTPIVGDVWFDDSSKESKIYDGTVWKVIDSDRVTSSTTVPTTPVEGDIWFDSSGSLTLTKVFNGTVWVQLQDISDDQKIDVFEIINDSLQISIEDDLESNKSIALGDLSIEPWYGTDNNIAATLNTEDMYVMSSKVGIGTETPNERLHIKQDWFDINTNNFGGGLKLEGTAPSISFWETENGHRWLWHVNQDNMHLYRRPSNGDFEQKTTVKNNGYFGVGTIDPKSRIQAEGNISLGQFADAAAGGVNRSYFVFGNEELIDNYGLKMHFSGTAWGPMLFTGNRNLDRFIAFGQSGTAWQDDAMIEWARFHDGDFGIGTTAPQFKTHVEDGSLFIGDITYSSNVIPSTNPGLATANGHRLVFDNSFNGTAGTGMAANKIVLHNSNWLAGFGVEGGSVTYHSGGYHTFYTNSNNTSYGTPRMIVRNNGRVGINTLNPTQTLSVNGNADKIGGGNWLAFSDKRIKDNIKPYLKGLNELVKIRPVSFTYNEKSGYSEEMLQNVYVGVLAQEIERLFPATVSQVNDFHGTSGFSDLRQFDSSELLWIVINAIKELDFQNKDLKLSLEQVQRRIEKLELKDDLD